MGGAKWSVTWIAQLTWRSLGKRAIQIQILSRIQMSLLVCIKIGYRQLFGSIFQFSAQACRFFRAVSFFESIIWSNRLAGYAVQARRHRDSVAFSHFPSSGSQRRRILHGCPFRHIILDRSAPLYVTFSTRAPSRETETERVPSPGTKGGNLRSLNGVQTLDTATRCPPVSVFRGSNVRAIAVKAFIRGTPSCRRIPR